MAARTCRSCGVTVAMGYARCPRCRAPLELEVGGLESSRARRISGAPGGTSMAPPSGSPRWLVAGAAASGVVGVVAALLLVRQSEPAAPAPAPREGEGVTEVEVQRATAVPEVASSPEAEAAPVASGRALSGLRSMLGKARLFAQLASFGDRLELRSASCEDSQLAAFLAEAREGLWQAGFRRVRCLAPHGQVVFERDL